MTDTEKSYVWAVKALDENGKWDGISWYHYKSKTEALGAAEIQGDSTVIKMLVEQEEEV